MVKSLRNLVVMMAVAGCVSLLASDTAFAQEASAAGVSNVENFIRSIIQVFAGLAGLVAAGFIVFGGFGYITSSGNPENLDKSKRTIQYSAFGLAISLGAFVLSSIVTELASKAFGS